MGRFRRTILISTIILGGCTAGKAGAYPRNPRNTLKYTQPQTEAPQKKATTRKVAYSLAGSTLRMLDNGIVKFMPLAGVFKSARINPKKVQMSEAGFPEKMKRKGKLLYFYSAGARGVAVASPGTNESTWIDVSHCKGIAKLGKVSFTVTDNIIAITGKGTKSLVVIGLGNLLKYEAWPVELRLDKLLARTKNQSLTDPRVSINKNRVYISDASLGKKRYFYQVVDGVPLPVSVEAD